MASSPDSNASQSTSHAAAVHHNFQSSGILVSEGTLDEYDVLKAIGKGKFSVVYRASRKSDGRLVAVKKVAIVDIMDKKTREKTLKEVKLLQRLKHPNVVAYLDAFLDGDAMDGGSSDLIIVLEWAEAGDLKRQLRKAIQKRARFEERIIWRYFSQIADAIGYMHSQRIMHRDLKPANIFLMADGTIKVGDLGLSRSLSENTLQAHSKVGTPLYMSPEVLRGNGYAFKSDVWSLGCILYELSALKSPFKEEGLNLYGLFQKINKGTYPPVPQPYSKTLRLLVRDMLMVDVDQRIGIVQVVETAAAMRIETEEAKKKARAKAALAQQQEKGGGGGKEQQQQQSPPKEEEDNRRRRVEGKVEQNEVRTQKREQKNNQKREQKNNQDEDEERQQEQRQPEQRAASFPDRRPQPASRHGRGTHNNDDDGGGGGGGRRENVVKKATTDDRIDIQPSSTTTTDTTTDTNTTTIKRVPRPNSAARRGRPASARRKRPAVEGHSAGPVRVIRGSNSDASAEGKVQQQQQKQQQQQQHGARTSPGKETQRTSSSSSSSSASPSRKEHDATTTTAASRPPRKEKAMSVRRRRDQRETNELMPRLGGTHNDDRGPTNGHAGLFSTGKAETNALTLMDMVLDKLGKMYTHLTFIRHLDIL